VYDCLFPHTVGGAERWYRNLAARLADSGHEVTYVTLRQWGRSENPDFGGVRVLAVGPRMPLYVRGRRRILPPLVFGLGTLAHLVRHRRRYDIVHTASFPYFSLLAAGLVRPISSFRVVVDWHEVWTREYWQEYLGPLGGRVGWAVQSLCLQIPQRAFCFSRLHERRLHEGGFRGELAVLEGEYSGSPASSVPRPAESIVVFAGRHIPEKRVDSLVPAIALARTRIPDLRAIIFGDGPDRAKVLALIGAHSLEGVVEAPGFVEETRVEQALASSLCLVLPSRREGYGLVLLEAMAKGTPVIVVSGPDNAAAELVVDGRNGFVAASASAEDIAGAIVRARSAGQALRESTLVWFESNAGRLSLEGSLEAVVSSYRR
jgi:glycosyltransferase involved in cell wall biosynthesis